MSATFSVSMIGRSAIGQSSRGAGAAGAWLLASFFLFAFILMPFPTAHGAEQQTLEITSKTGVHVFTVDLAVTDKERERGLMFRRSLPEFYGMLFDFKQDQEVLMWMKNTYVSLDMIFIQSDGRIRRIAENTQVQSERIIPSGGPVRAVLEVVAGTARKLGIEAGDRVASPILPR